MSRRATRFAFRLPATVFALTALTMSLTGCPDKNPPAVEAEPPTPTPEPTDEPTPEPSSAPVPTPTAEFPPPAT